MAKRFPPRVRVTCATIGNGQLTLGAAISTKYQAIPAGYDLDVVDYTIEDGNDWEEGYGIYEAAFGTLTRNLIQSSTGSLLNLSGNSQVFSTIASRSMDSLFSDTIIVPAGTEFVLGDPYVDIDVSAQEFRSLVVAIQNAQYSGFGANRLQLLWSADGISFVGGIAVAVDGAGTHFASSSTISTSPVALVAGATESRTVRIEGAHALPGTLIHTVGEQPGTASPNYFCQGTIVNKITPIVALRIDWSGLGVFDGFGTYGVFGKF